MRSFGYIYLKVLTGIVSVLAVLWLVKGNPTAMEAVGEAFQAITPVMENRAAIAAAVLATAGVMARVEQVAQFVCQEMGRNETVNRA